MKVALVYDRVNKFGGAERVLLSLKKIFPEAPLYTLVHDPKKAKWAKDFKVIPTFFSYLPFLRSRHELLAPLAPLAFETQNLNEYDVVISITSSDAKAVITKPKTLHLCYCLTPTRYLWHGAKNYRQDWKMRLTPKFLRNYFKQVDTVIANRPDQYLSISKEVKNRISKYYHRDSDVIYPAIDDKFFSANTLVKASKRKYFLLVSRLVPYKKVDLAIKTFNQLNLPLIIVGTGSEYQKLKNLANQNIIFVGTVDDQKLIEYYRHAKAVIFPQEEDFGLVPVESQACGTPVIAFARGGALETIINFQTGIFFKHQTVSSLSRAILHFQKLNFSPSICRRQARHFSESYFLDQFSAKVLSLWEKHQKTPTSSC